jgi:Zn-dependent oligopeptidase
MESLAGVTAADLEPALDERLRRADEALDAAVAAAPDTAGVLVHLDRASRHAVSGFGRTGSLWAVHPDTDVRAAATSAMIRFESWRSRTFARQDLYDALATLEDADLDGPQRRHLSLWRASQRLNGAHLDEAGRQALAGLQHRAAELASAIDTGFPADLPILELRREDLDGLPADVLDRFAGGEAPGTVRVPVDFQTRDAFMAHVRRRDLRERFWRALYDRGLATTLEPMRELFDVRRQIATLAGFGSWAELRTSISSVGSVAAAEAILDDLAGPSRRAAEAFIEACEAALDGQLGDEGYRPWDQYAAIRELTAALGTDREAIRPYLPVEAVAGGLFRLAREVFGVRVDDGEPGLGWHEDVRTLVISDDATGEVLGVCLWDPWDRPGKMAGTVGFMEVIEVMPPDADGRFPPVATMLVTMFPKPPPGGRTHISVGDAEVLFHEFGHVLDFTIGMRTSVALDDSWWGRDWVEGPSFSIGFWARSPTVIATYARHPDTGEAVPAALVEPLDTVQAIEDVPYVARYLQLARVDLAVHGPEPVDLDEVWRRAAADSPFPEPAVGFRPFALSMVSGGYDAALYGVDYALTIRDELLAEFARGGWLSPAVGRAYIRDVLAPGAFVPPTERLATFLGHPPTSAPLIAKLEGAIEAVRAATSGVGGRPA